jgi:hypothetical protein
MKLKKSLIPRDEEGMSPIRLNGRDMDLMGGPGNQFQILEMLKISLKNSIRNTLVNPANEMFERSKFHFLSSLKSYSNLFLLLLLSLYPLTYPLNQWSRNMHVTESMP